MRLRCCERSENLREQWRAGLLALVCTSCGTVLATSDSRGELFADY